MECGAMVCYSMGAINSLVDKITQMMANHPLMEGLLQDLIRLREDPMNKFARAKVVGEQVKVWMKQVRELVYDMEDWIDLKQEAAAAGFSDEEDKLQIEEFKEQIQEAMCRCERYELFNQVELCSAAAAAVCGEVVIAGRRRLLPEEIIVPVGLQVPKSELRDLMMDGQKELKVVSILGQEGMGKTTLAKAVYEDVKGQFKCQGFVSVGRPTSAKATLVEIFRQVKPEADDQEALFEKQTSEIITKLWRFLRTMRYLICIDDVRGTQELEVIKSALPNNKQGSRILVTTRKEDIAKLCSRRPKDVVYEMSALKDDFHNMLFRGCVYAEEQDWPDLLIECSEGKLKEVCGGVPLAIITSAGGLLGRTSEEQQVPEQPNAAVLSELDKLHPAKSEAMRKILNICYGDLPLPLRSCLLYMTAFPGNYDVKKDRLLRRWVAEGIIPDRHGKSSWETAESYFDELVSRRLIQPIFDYSDGEATGCNVQGAVYDFLESLATKENFVTTAGVELMMSGTFPCERVRRVSSIHFDVEEEVDTMVSNSSTSYCLLDDKSLVDSISAGTDDEANSWQLPGVRTLAFSGDAGRIPELLPAFRHLRVLDLEDSKGLVEEQLESIGGLFQLRYLGLGRTDVTRLPAEIVALKLLSTLDLRGSGVRHLPEIRDGKKLVSLLGDQLILKGEMRGMEKLEEVSKVLLGPDGSAADSMAGLVRESSQLRMLGVRFSHLHGQSATDRQRVQHFLTAVGESKLQSLVLDDYLQPLLGMLAHSLAANSHLQKLEVRVAGYLPQVPEEMGYLKALTHLHINVQAVEAQAVRVLGSLPRLVLLELYSLTSPSGLQVSGEDRGFPSLEVLWYNTKYGAGMGLRFKKGDEQPPMPKLRRLRVDIDARGTRCRYDDAFDLGIEDLPCLVRVHATIDWKDATLAPSEVLAVEKDMRDQVSQHPNHPVLELNRSRRAAAPAQSVIVINSLGEWDKRIGCSKLVLIHFTTSWCAASSSMAPVIADLAKSFADVVFLKVDVERGKLGRIAASYGITVVPTFLFIKGGHTKYRVEGGGPAKGQELKDMLNKLLS